MFVAIHRCAAIEVRLPVGQHLRHVVGVGPAVQRLGQVGDLAFGEAEHGQDAAGEKFLPGRDVPVPDPVACAFQRQLPERFVLTQGRFGGLAFGDVEQDAHPQETIGIGRHGAGSAKHPLDLPIGQHDAELAPELDRPLADLLHVLFDPRRILGMPVARDQHRVAHQILRTETIDVANTRTHETVAALPGGCHMHHEDHARYLRGDQAQLFLALAQCQLGKRAFGDVFDRTFVVQQLPTGIANRVGVFADPQVLAPLVARHLGHESLHEAVTLQPAVKLAAPPRHHIPVGGDAVDVLQHRCFGSVAIELHQRRVGAQHHTVGRTAVGTDGQEVEQRGEIPERR
ncbi:hypothetical protein Y695_03260 [Hydrogenophaga sp. T4]|nr:hypothetical protein Y695_03260 [Hydrogenophaga sp. T4]